jgi:acetolactate synthase I/II/III large subunit
LRTMLRQSERPVFYLGAGVRLAGAETLVTRLAEHFGCPVVTGFNAHDLIPSDHPMYAGRPGTIGDRSGNFCVQRADLVVVIGCRLNIRQISYNWSAFAREAQLVVVDIDEAELKKPTISPTFTMHADALDVMTELLVAPADRSAAQVAWAEWCRSLRERYPVVVDEYWQRTGRINPYCFGAALSELSADTDVVVTGDGTACISTFQSMNLRGQQRLFSDSGSAPMGFDVPAAIGAATGGASRVVCIAGDGSLMMNLQELQTISGHRLPIKLFIFNNDGYLSIKLTQRGFFEGRYVGSGPSSGVTFPDFRKLASAFDLPFERVAEHTDLHAAIKRTLESDGPAVCEVMLDPDQPFAPRVSSKRLADGTLVTAPQEDMFPFLPPDEVRDVMAWSFASRQV